MAHLALYRTYRPQNFDAVVGQSHIVQTVKNQIQNDLLAHAYMFTGPRGTGKTSIARIVAKAINCTKPSEGNPCSACESCVAINSGSHPDVLELDGASNNGVDEIRDIRDRVKYSPSLSAYKVYIIDEVHMLSTGAFNALLKTLEEPPSHVIFMLATTEIHKVPDTILSRTQRFDLKQIPDVAMEEHLSRILEELSIESEAGVTGLVATLAAGGLRDALSMLDQAIAYKTDIIRLTDIHDLNGSVRAEALVEIIKHTLNSNFEGLVTNLRALLAAGKLPLRIIDGLLQLLRDVLKDQKLGTNNCPDLATLIPSEQIFNYIKHLNSLGHDLKIANDAQLMLEIGLLELGFVPSDPLQQESVSTTDVPFVAAAPDVSIEVKMLTAQLQQLESVVASLRENHSVQTRESTIPIPAQPTVEPIVPSVDPTPSPAEDTTYELSAPDNPVATVVTKNQKILNDSPTSTSENLLIEDILSGASTTAKVSLQNKVGGLNAFADLDLKEVVMLVKDAEIAAASNIGCILVYDYETMVQKLLSPENKKLVQRILMDLMGSDYGFIALPKDFWLTQRQNYVEQSKLGVQPTLEQYPQSVEATDSLTVAPSLAMPQPIQDVVDMFGDLVEIID